MLDCLKVDGKMLYSKNSPAIMSQLLSMVFVNFLAWREEGMKGVKACWAIPKGWASSFQFNVPSHVAGWISYTHLQ